MNALKPPGPKVIALIGFLSLVVATLLLGDARVGFDANSALVQTVNLNDLPWEDAQTGWRELGSIGPPTVDKSFGGAPLSVLGQSYAKGIGVYPTARITYELNGPYVQFDATAAVDDATPEGQGPIRFLVFGDDAPLYDSGLLSRGDGFAHDVGLAFSISSGQPFRATARSASMSPETIASRLAVTTSALQSHHAIRSSSSTTSWLNRRRIGLAGLPPTTV